MKLRLHGRRRVLGHLPCWRHPAVAEAWAAHETAGSDGRRPSVTAHDLSEIKQRVSDDPVITINAEPDDGTFDVDEAQLRLLQGNPTLALGIALTPAEVPQPFPDKLSDEEIGALAAGHDPAVSFDVDSVPAILDGLVAEGLATVDDAGGWAQTQAGMDLLTGGRAQAHSDHVAAALGVQPAETAQEAPHE